MMDAWLFDAKQMHDGGGGGGGGDGKSWYHWVVRDS